MPWYLLVIQLNVWHCRSIVADCLSSFMEVEQLEDTELYMCANCKTRQKSTKKFWIRRLPNVQWYMGHSVNKIVLFAYQYKKYKYFAGFVLYKKDNENYIFQITSLYRHCVMLFLCFNSQAIKRWSEMNNFFAFSSALTRYLLRVIVSVSL